MKIGLSRLLSFLFFLGSHCAYGAPDSGTIRPVISNQGQEKNLSQMTVAGLSTDIVFDSRDLIPNESNSVFLLYAGTGAKLSNWGIGPSMAPIANKLISLKSAPIGFENPMYFNKDQSAELRTQTVEKFGTLEAQIEWFVQTIEFAAQKIGRTESGKLKKPLFIATRSTSTGIMLEILHRHSIGDRRVKIMNDVTSVLLTGLLSHRPELFQKWYQREVALEVTHGIELDPLISRKDVEIFEPMKWGAHELPPPPLNEKASTSPMEHSANPTQQWGVPEIGALSEIRRYPFIHLMLGFNDFLSPADEQVQAIEDFARGHGEFQITVFGSDTSHNAASSVKYKDLDGKDVKVKTMKRLGPLLEGVLKAKDITYQPGLKFVADPTIFQIPNVCANVLEKFGLTTQPAKTKS